jgi:hypothetical protein
VIAGLTAVGLALVMPGNTYIVIASMAAATVGSSSSEKPRGRSGGNG